MTAKPVKKVVIAGGGSAGWCAATALSKMLGPLIEVTLIESDEIGIVGVGEATIPTIRSFHHLCGIDERDFMRATNASIKLGIEFRNWAREDDNYIHSFGTIGQPNWMADFHHVWLQARADGIASDIGDYCFELRAAREGKFQSADKVNINYAYHFDTALYGKYLRKISEARGVKRIEGKISEVRQDDLSGFVTALVMESGAVIEGDLFIDCTGFRGLLIEGALKTGYDDWSHWLATDRALAVQTASKGAIMPYTEAVAHADGWRWRIPLQNRVGNGLVYCSQTLSEDEARSRFLSQLDGPPLFEPRLISYRTGQRRKVWNKNVVAMGLASGFIEPLESTNIHLFQISATRLVQLFPFDGVNEALVDRYNVLARHEVENIRDFVIMHYKLTQRDDSAFWRARRDMDVPDTLKERIALFSESGHVYQALGEVFRIDSWVQVMLGQRLEPQRWHHLAQLMDRKELSAGLEAIKSGINRAVAGLPSHQAFLESYCALDAAK
jgi:tryptophan 7-halogenase